LREKWPSEIAFMSFDHRSLPASGLAGPASPGVPWADTDIKTQFSTGAAGRPVEALRDIGSAVGKNTRELFVSCDAAQAMQMQLELTGLRYIAIGDLGGSLARRCLNDISRASGWPVQRLLIRRQGYGDTLASLLFIDAPAQNGRHVRVFCTEADTDADSRLALKHLLVARAELVALFVPDLAPQALTQSVDTLCAEVAANGGGQSPNRHLIFMPVKTSPEMVGHIARFRMQTGIQARLAPAVRRADQAWVYLGSTWNQLQEGVPLERLLRLQTLALVAPRAPVPEPDRAPAEAMPSSAVMAQRCVRYLMRQPGVQRVCLFDLQSLAIHAHSATGQEALVMAKQGRAMLSALGRGGDEMALGHALSEASFTLMAHRVVLRGAAVVAGAVVHVIMDRNALPLGPLPSQAVLAKED
jgi:hypothetical protein